MVTFFTNTLNMVFVATWKIDREMKRQMSQLEFLHHSVITLTKIEKIRIETYRLFNKYRYSF